MEAEKISVIIPVYNVEKYLSRCLDSIINQTYRNLEIIIVDDGSKDSSGKIADKYANEDSRIVVIHQENKGISAARNVGMSIASGRYILFEDSDDYVDYRCIEKLYNIIIEYDVDVACCKIEVIYESVQSEVSLVEKSQTNENVAVDVISGEDVTKSLLCDKMKNYVSGKLFKSEILVNFIDGRIYEDVAWAYLVFDNAKKVAFIDMPLSYYCIRPTSITGVAGYKGLSHQFLGFVEQLDFCKKKYPDLVGFCEERALHCAVGVCNTQAKGYEIPEDIHSVMINLMKAYSRKLKEVPGLNRNKKIQIRAILLSEKLYIKIMSLLFKK